MIYNLPKGYLSYSAYDLWKKSKEQYRKRYYMNEKQFDTAETLFGKATDTHLDEGGTIDGVINFNNPQYSVEVEYKGLKLLSRLDDFNADTLQILERKTGHKNLQGKSPWDIVKVRKHQQLLFYSTVIELKHGKVHPIVILQWLETEFKDKTIEFDGHTLRAGKGKLELTGNIQTFKRTIHKWERQRFLKELLKVAEEIHNDFTEWKKIK